MIWSSSRSRVRALVAAALTGCSAGPAAPAEPPLARSSAPERATQSAASRSAPSSAPTAAQDSPSSLANAVERCFAAPIQLDASARPLRSVAGNFEEKIHGCLSSSERDRCELNVAQTYFETGHILAVAPIARRIALATRDRVAGEAAAQLELETLNEIGTHAFPPRAECYDVMAADIGPLLDINCRCDPTTGKPTPLCDTLHHIERDVQRLNADKLVTTAQRSDDAGALYEKAADAYWELFNRHCSASCGPAPDSKELLARRCDEIAFNAYRAGLAAKDPRRTTRARDALLAPKGGLDKSPLAEKVRKEPLPPGFEPR